MYIYKIVIYILCFQFVTELHAQQSSLYSQYMFNGLLINPAYAGSNEALNVTALSRKQWSGIEGAPLTSVLSVHSPIKHKKMGLGLIVSNDKVSIYNTNTISAIYSYKVALSSKQTLSFGLQGGVINYNIRYSELNAKSKNDPVLNIPDFNIWNTTFGAGVYYYTDRLYLGLSSPLLSSNIFSKKEVDQKNLYMFSYGYIIILSNDFKLKPNGLIKYYKGNEVQFDINVNLLFRDAIWVGASYRTRNMLYFLTQLNITKQFRIGYAYDINIGPLANLNSGSHELMLSYLFSFSKSDVVSPRYF